MWKVAILVTLISNVLSAPPLKDCIDPCVIDNLKLPRNLDFSKPGNWSEHNAYDINGGNGKVHEEYGQYEDSNTRVRYFKKNSTYGSRSREFSGDSRNVNLPENFGVEGLRNRHDSSEISQRQSNNHFNDNSRDYEFSRRFQQDHNENNQAASQYENHEEHRQESSQRRVYSSNQRIVSQQTVDRIPHYHYGHDYYGSQNQQASESQIRTTNGGNANDNNFHSAFRTPSGQFRVGVIDLNDGTVECTEEHNGQQPVIVERVSRQKKDSGTDQLVELLDQQSTDQMHDLEQQQTQSSFQQTNNFNLPRDANANINSGNLEYSGHNLDQQIGDTDGRRPLNWYPRYHGRHHSLEKDSSNVDGKFEFGKKPGDLEVPEKSTPSVTGSTEIDDMKDREPSSSTDSYRITDMKALVDAISEQLPYVDRDYIKETIVKYLSMNKPSNEDSLAQGIVDMYLSPTEKPPKASKENNVGILDKGTTQQTYTKDDEAEQNSYNQHLQGNMADSRLLIPKPVIEDKTRQENSNDEDQRINQDKIPGHYVDTALPDHKAVSAAGQSNYHHSREEQSSHYYGNIDSPLTPHRMYNYHHHHRHFNPYTPRHGPFRGYYMGPPPFFPQHFERTGIFGYNHNPFLNKYNGYFEPNAPTQEEEEEADKLVETHPLFEDGDQRKKETEASSEKLFTTERIVLGRVTEKPNYHSQATETNHQQQSQQEFQDYKQVTSSLEFGSQTLDKPNFHFTATSDPSNQDQLSTSLQTGNLQASDVELFSDDKRATTERPVTCVIYPSYPANSKTSFRRKPKIVPCPQPPTTVRPIEDTDNVEVLQSANSNLENNWSQPTTFSVGTDERNEMRPTNENLDKFDRYRGDVPMSETTQRPTTGPGYQVQQSVEDDNEQRQQLQISDNQYITQAPRQLSNAKLNEPQVYSHDSNYKPTREQSAYTEGQRMWPPRIDNIQLFHRHSNDQRHSTTPQPNYPNNYWSNANQENVGQTNNGQHTVEIRNRLNDMYKNQYVSSYNRQQLGNYRNLDNQQQMPPNQQADLRDEANQREMPLENVGRNSPKPVNQQNNRETLNQPMRVDYQQVDKNFQTHQTQNDDFQQVADVFGGVSKENMEQRTAEAEANPQIETRILEAFGGGDLYNRNRSHDFSNAKLNPSATLAPLTDGEDPWIVNEKPAENVVPLEPAIWEDEEFPAHVTQLPTAPPKPPGFWSRLGQKITNTYDKAREKTRNIFG